MPESKFKKLLRDYRQDIINGEKSVPTISGKIWIRILVERDNIDKVMNDLSINKYPESMLELVELDSRLRLMLEKYGPDRKTISKWQLSLNPFTNSWWWSSRIGSIESNVVDKINWVWRFLTVLFLTISIGLVLDISPKFLYGGPDTAGAFAVVFQSVLTALVLGGSLTNTGQEVINRLFQNGGIPLRYQQGLKFGMVLILTILLFALRVSLPAIAISYNNQGLLLYRQGRYSGAESNYLRAIKLNPDYAEAHYNLGLIYEDLHDNQNARLEYRLALLGGLDAAYNNLAHLYILDEDYSGAVPFLLNGLEIAKEREIRYDLLKNLGWARFGQERFAEAESSLSSAITLNPEKAAAYCLLAQVLDVKKRNDEALSAWNNCLKFASEKSPDEDMWINLARKRLDSVEGNQ